MIRPLILDRFWVANAAAALIIAAQVAVADDWSSYQHDAAHTGLSTAQVDAKNVSLAWRAPANFSTPVIAGHTVYATQNGQGTNNLTTISSFELATGAINWSYSGEFVFPSQAGVGGGFVAFVGAPTVSSPSALYVLDATTGALRYTVPVIEGLNSVMPAMVQDQVTGTTTAYVANGSNVSAVSLGTNSGSVLWTQAGSYGGSSMPCVFNNSIIMAGPGQYYAIDRSTGAQNHFHAGNISGGGGTTVAGDVARNQFYVLEYYNDTTVALSAYHYTDNNNITLLWQSTGDGVGYGGSVAIGPTGKVYSAGNGVIWELDPTTGAILRSITGAFANAITPALSNGVLWAYSSGHTFAFDLNSLQVLRALSGSRGSLNSAYDGPGAICNNHFLIDYGNIVGSPGFDVYVAPGPVHLSGAVSRMTHGAAGVFDVNLPQIGSPGIECRIGANGNYKIVFMFDETLVGVVGGASLSSGVGSVSGSGIDPSDSHNYIVNLTGVANAQVITISLSNVSDSGGGFSSSVSTTMGVLLGDVNADGFVNVGDTVQVKAQSGSNVTSSNFRDDVNFDGFINVGDTVTVKAQSGTGLPTQISKAGSHLNL